MSISLEREWYVLFAVNVTIRYLSQKASCPHAANAIYSAIVSCFFEYQEIHSFEAWRHLWIYVLKPWLKLLNILCKASVFSILFLSLSLVLSQSYQQSLNWQFRRAWNISLVFVLVGKPVAASNQSDVLFLTLVFLHFLF